MLFLRCDMGVLQTELFSLCDPSGRAETPVCHCKRLKEFASASQPMLLVLDRIIGSKPDTKRYHKYQNKKLGKHKKTHHKIKSVQCDFHKKKNLYSQTRMIFRGMIRVVSVCVCDQCRARQRPGT